MPTPAQARRRARRTQPPAVVSPSLLGLYTLAYLALGLAFLHRHVTPGRVLFLSAYVIWGCLMWLWICSGGYCTWFVSGR